MSDTNESYIEPLTSQLPAPSIESVKNDVTPLSTSAETVRLSGSPQPSQNPEPSVEYEKKSL